MKQYYKYYKASEADSAALLNEWETSMGGKSRQDIVREFLSDHDAEAVGTRAGWGGPDVVTSLLLKKGHALIGKPATVVENDHVFVDGVACVRARPRMTTKEGKALAAHMKKFNADLKARPTFPDWVVQRLGIMATGIGGPSPSRRGAFSMISTNAGMAGDVLVAQVPIDGHPAEMPTELNRITYGTFYDLTEEDDA
jgi:hypothetical protein